MTQLDGSSAKDLVQVKSSETIKGAAEPKAEQENPKAENAGPGRLSQRWSMKNVPGMLTFKPTPPARKGSDSDSDGQHERVGEGSVGTTNPTSGPSAPGSPKKSPKGPKYDPEEYQHAKKQLKKAVLECYR